MIRPLSVALVSLCLALPVAAQRDGAVFRFDELERRDFDYNDEYFLNVLNYRQRITYRWNFRQAALGYDITAGSLRNDELYLNQRAIVRLPFSDVLTGEYRFVEWEDYDQRFQRNEVEVLFRLFRPSMRLPLTETVGRTPMPDGLFFGGTGLLDADKEFADIGLVLGYRNTMWGLRLDAIAPDFFFNAKNAENAEYTSDPYTLRATAYLDLLDGNLSLEAWVNQDLPLRLTLPERNGGLVFRYHQLRSGLDVRWRARHDLRFDLEAWAERTRKRRRASDDPDPLSTDDLNREAFRAILQCELDVEPLWGETASRKNDTWIFSLFVHLLNEVRRRPRAPFTKEVIRRGEAYAEVGYVLAIPSPGPDYRFGIRASVLGGFLSERDVRPADNEHRVREKLLLKLAGGFEVGFLEDRASAFFQMTWRADDQSFGGGNVQVQMTF